MATLQFPFHIDTVIIRYQFLRHHSRCPGISHYFRNHWADLALHVILGHHPREDQIVVFVSCISGNP